MDDAESRARLRSPEPLWRIGRGRPAWVARHAADVPLRYSILLRSGYRRRPAPTLDASDCPVRIRATPGRGREAAADVSGGAVTVEQTSGRRVTTELRVKPPTVSDARGSRPAHRPTR